MNPADERFAARIPSPSFRLRSRRPPRLLREPALTALRWVIPPLAALCHLVETVRPPFFGGLRRRPRSPWTPAHWTLVLAAAAYSVHAFVPVPNLEGWLSQLEGRLEHGPRVAELAAGAAGWLRPRAEPVRAIGWIVLIAWAVAHFTSVGHRATESLVWRRARSVLVHLTDSRDRRGRTSRALLHVALLLLHAALLGCLVLAARAATGEQLHPGFDPPPEGWLLAASVLLVLTLVLAWRLRPPADSPEERGEGSTEDPVGLPDLRGDGDMPLPQLDPREPLRFPPIPFGDRRSGRVRASRFGALFIRGLSAGIAWHPSGRAAGPRTFAPSELTLPGGRSWQHPKSRAKRAPTLAAPPAAIARALTDVMYLSASASPLISSSQNAVFKGFLRAHPFSLLLGEGELAEILLEVADQPWQRRGAAEIARDIEVRLKRLDGLGLVDAYLDEAIASGIVPEHRTQAGEFDPFHDGGFDDMHVEFGAVARRLIQAVVFADRRITPGESDLLQELGMGRAFPAPARDTDDASAEEAEAP